MSGAKVITPTVGRRVWFRPNGIEKLNGAKFTQIKADQPMDAGVAYVWGDRMVNLSVVDHAGVPHAAMSVVFRQPGDPEPTSGAYAEWMPFQVGQAKALDDVKPYVWSDVADHHESHGADGQIAYRLHMRDGKSYSGNTDAKTFEDFIRLSLAEANRQRAAKTT